MATQKKLADGRTLEINPISFDDAYSIFDAFLSTIKAQAGGLLLVGGDNGDKAALSGMILQDRRIFDAVKWDGKLLPALAGCTIEGQRITSDFVKGASYPETILMANRAVLSEIILLVTEEAIAPFVPSLASLGGFGATQKAE